MMDSSDLANHQNGAAAAADAKPSIETVLFSAGLMSADDLGELVRDAVVAQRPVAALAVERNLVTPQVLRALLEQARPDVSLDEALGLAREADPPSLQPDLQVVAEPLAAAPAPQPLQVLVPPVSTPGPAPEALSVTVAAPAAPEPTAFDPAVPNGAAPPAQPLVPEAPVAEAPVVEPVLELAPEEAPAATDPAPEGAFEVVVRLAVGECVHVGRAATFAAAEELARATAERFATATQWPFVGGRCIRPEGVVSVDISRTLDG